METVLLFIFHMFCHGSFSISSVFGPFLSPHLKMSSERYHPTPNDECKSDSLEDSDSGDLKEFHALYEKVHKKFDDAVDIFSKDGVTKTDLFLTMCYISMETQHDIKETYPNGRSIIFYCANAPTFARRNKRIPILEDVDMDDVPFGEMADEKDLIKDPCDISSKDGEEKKDFCHFFFRFSKRKTGLWVFRTGRLTKAKEQCHPSSTPTLCMHKKFLADFIQRHLYRGHPSDCNEATKEKTMKKLETQFGLTPRSTTFHEAWNIMHQIDYESVLEQNQKVESYLMTINKNGHYGTVLYSNGDLLVPTTDGTCSMRDFRQCFETNELFPIDFRDRNSPFWDLLPQKVVVPGQKSIYLTFEAVGAAVRAFQFSLPVICLDACSMKGFCTQGTIISACFATTECELLTMCFGTADSESSLSYDFFLANLRIALKRYCPDLNLERVVFMSDRNNTIALAIKRRFPESTHLLCARHIKNGLRCSPAAKDFFWLAAEAETIEEFNSAFDQFVKMVPKEAPLRTIAVKWARYAIAKTCRRYAVRTNNWVESQNNEMKSICAGSILSVLLDSFNFAASKIREFQQL